MSSTLSQVLVVAPGPIEAVPPTPSIAIAKCCLMPAEQSRRIRPTQTQGQTLTETHSKPNERTQYFFINSLRRRAGNKFCAVNLSHDFSWPITTIGQQQCSSDRTHKGWPQCQLN